GSGSSAGNATCAIITASEPALIPASNGGSSTAFRRSSGAFTRARFKCESTSVSPCPKVFQRGQHPALMRSPDIRRDHLANLCRVLAIRAGVDDRVLRINLHVGDGIEVPVDAQRTRLLRHELPKLLC